jgi:pimeloyl-ACP methyl ester carboxylesterase
MEAEIIETGWESTKLMVNGLSLHVVDAGPKDGPLLILLHGFPDFWWGWRHQITPLAESGFHVLAPDLRGYNLSNAPQDVESYVLDTLVADVIALANHYVAERFYLVGHDWGGIIAWGVAARHSNRLERLVVMDAPHPDLWTEELLKHPTQALRSSYAALFQLPWLPEQILGSLNFAVLKFIVEASARQDAFKPGEIERYAEAWAEPGSLTAMLNYYRALPKRKKPDHPAKILCPVLVFWGEKDSFLEHHVARASLEHCSNGQLFIVKGATHWLHLEEPTVVSSKIIEFFESKD